MAEMVLRAQTGTPESAPLPNIGEIPGEELAARSASALPIFAGQGFHPHPDLLHVDRREDRLRFGAACCARGRRSRARSLPREALYTLFATSLAAIFLDGFTGVFATTLTGAFLMAFALQGLAAVHEMSGRPFGAVPSSSFSPIC